MAREFALDNRDFESLAISLLLELGAYEAMWDNPGVTFKTLSEKFAANPGALPSDFVTVKKAEEYSDFVRERFRAAHIDRFGVRVHGAGEYPDKLRDAAHPVELIYYQGWWDLVDSRCVAVVGARKPSDQGLARTRPEWRYKAAAIQTVADALRAALNDKASNPHFRANSAVESEDRSAL